ncbi:MAG: hypothetical protein PHX83_02715 [Acidobacteriia bacterium]|nr:hypothetical protein [Terriglobia bacterium]
MKNTRTMKALLFLTLILGLTLSLLAADAWKAKKYTDWTEQEAMQILNRSPWASQQSTVAGMYSEMPGSSTTTGGRRSQSNNDDVNMANYVVAWYSAMPVRQAHARLASLKNRAKPEDLQEFLAPVGDVCLITVTGQLHRRFEGANKEELLKKTYLQVKGKPKVFATDYQAPSATSRLAIFQFPRTLDNAPIFTENDKEVEFISTVEGIRIQASFAPKKMIFEDKLNF